MTDIEILEFNMGGVLMKDATSLTFFGWLANKLNNVPITNDGKLNELRTAVANPPIMPRLANETKIKYVRNLLELGISI